MRYLTLLALLACGSDDGSEPLDTGPDAPSCLELWQSGLTEPDAEGPNTQIYGTSTFDGEHVWMAWNRRDQASGFDVWLARYGCDGTLQVGPIEATASDDNETTPVIAASGDRVLVAWSSDNGSSPSNLDIRYRVFDLQGEPLTEVIELEASRKGSVVDGNTWMPALAPTDQGFLLAGSWGHDESPAFQAFAVDLDFDGQVLGEAIDGEVDAEFGQTGVRIAHRDGRSEWVWQEDSTTSVQPVAVHAALGGATNTLGDPGARPDVAIGPGGTWYAYDDNQSDVVVVTPSGDRVTLSARNQLHSPRIASVGDSAAVLVMQLANNHNRLKLFHIEADGTIASETTVLEQGAPSPYGVRVTLIDETHAVVVYQDGVSPDFRLKALWVEL